MGREVFRRRIPNDLELIRQELLPFWSDLVALGVESTFNWYWLVDGLRALGLDARLGNPAKLQQYEGLKNTNDQSDARWLAELLRLGIFPASYIYPLEVRGVRDLLRRRQLFVHQQTQALLSLKSLLARYGVPMPGVYALKK